MKRTPEQLQAIEATLPELAIHAGAGAGKTDVLVERYLSHVRNDRVGPEKILAITFTRKAAADMKRRIVAALREAGLSDQARIAQVGPISTIHAFCERILREYPFDAGVDPKFDVLDMPKTDELLRACAKRAISNPRSLSEYACSLLVSHAGKTAYKLPPDEIAAALISWVADTLPKLRTAGRTPDELQQYAGAPDCILNEWSRFVRTKVLEQTGFAPPEQAWCDVDAIRLCFVNAKAKTPQWLPKATIVEAETKAAELCAGLTELVHRAWLFLLDELDQTCALDFTELETRALKLLETRPAVLEGKYEFVMVDEAQDLNPLQFRILRAIPTKNRLFVGDPQQSIYGFRGAERQLFIQQMAQVPSITLTTNFRSTPTILATVESLFRGVWSDTLTKMNPPNGVLSRSGNPSTCSPEWPPVEIWRVPDSQAEEHIATGVRYLYDQGTPLQNIAILLRNATKIELLVRGLVHKGLPYTIVPGIGRNYFLRSEIYDLASALQAVSDPTDDLALVSLLRSPLVGLSLDAVTQITLAANKHKISVWQFLRTHKPLLNSEDANAITAFLTWFKPLSSCADRLPAWNVLSQIFAATALDARFSLMADKAHLIANSRRLLTIAIERQEMGPKEFAAWIHSQQQMHTNWADAPMSSEDSNALRISTIHRAKGLEWHTVVVAATHRTGREPDSPIVCPSLATPLFPPAKGDYQPLIWRIALNESKVADDHEELRLLYVALTRAKNKLAIVVPSDTRNRWSELILNRLAPNWTPLEGVVVKDFSSPRPC